MTIDRTKERGVWVALGLAMASLLGALAPLSAHAQSTNAAGAALILDSFKKDPGVDWNVSGDGTSASKDGKFGHQEIQFPVPASVPSGGATFIWTLSASATISNLATECEVKAPGFVATGEPGLHASAFSEAPGKTNSVTVKITLKPGSISPGATADLGVGCFDNLGLHFLYKAAASALTTTTTEAPHRCTPQSGSPSSAPSAATPERLAFGGRGMSVVIADQAVVGCDISVGIRIVSPSGNSTHAEVAPKTTVTLHVDSSGVVPGMRVGVQARALGFGGPFVRFGDCAATTCDVTTRSDKVAGGEYRAIIMSGPDQDAVSDSVSVRWEIKDLTFDYTVPDRFTDVTVTATTAEVVRPNVWPVDLAVTDCPDATKAGTTYTWTVAPASGGTAARGTSRKRPTPTPTETPLAAKWTTGCTWRAEFDGPGKAKNGSGEGVFQVKLKVETAADGAYQATGRVLVQDWLVVGIGDSLASGEGAPLSDPNAGAGAAWQDLICDRSSASYQAQAAKALELSDKKTSVTFVHLGCSGASIVDHSPNNRHADGGLVDAYTGINPGNTVLPPQLTQAKNVIGNREVDAVLMSIGVNDLEFGPIVTYCADPTAHVGTCAVDAYTDSAGQPFPSVRAFVQTRVGELPLLYRRLAAAFSATFGLGFPGNRFPAGRVFIPEYPDSLHTDSSLLCDKVNLGEAGAQESSSLVGLNAKDIDFMANEFRAPLNRAIMMTQQQLGWNPVNIGAADFIHHGICANDHWITTVAESKSQQGNKNGALHPNVKGYQELAKLVFDDLHSSLYRTGEARAPLT